MSSKFSELTTPERWQWYAEMYAHRRIFLGVPPDVRTAPFDEDGKWFDAHAVDQAERHKRDEIARTRERVNRTASDPKLGKMRRLNESETMAEAAFIENEWARTRRYLNFEDYKRIERIDHVSACVRIIQSLPGPKTMPRESQPTGYAATLGVKAREYTPDELRKGRIDLGLEHVYDEEGKIVEAAK